MTQQELEEGQMIGKFIGISLQEERSLLTGIDNPYLVDSNRNPFDFRARIDLLIVVLQKIIRDDTIKFFGENHLALHQPKYHHTLSVNLLLDPALLYKAIVEFIKWYNSQTNEQWPSIK